MQPFLKPIDRQVVVITGASSGIGLATALRAAAAGARVVLAARNQMALDDIVGSIEQAGGEATAVVTDVTQRDEVERLRMRAIEVYGGFDTWVNDAGSGLYGRIEDTEDTDHRQLFEVNYWGLVYGSKAAVKHLKQKGGAIINLGSVASDVAIPVQGMYSATKHAIKGFTDALRLELAQEGAPISVTLIKPAAIDTPFPAHAKNLIDGEPKLPPPVYRPEDVADAIIHAAQHGGRDYYIGGGGKLMSSLNKRVPSLMDWVGSSQAAVAQQSRGAPNRPREGALYHPTTGGAMRGDSPHLVRRSLYTQASMHPLATAAALATVGIAGAALLRRNKG